MTPGLPPKQNTCFSWHCLTRLLIVTLFFHYLLFVSFILISLSPFNITSPPPSPCQTSPVQGPLLKGAQQNITHKPLVNDKLLGNTYSLSIKKCCSRKTIHGPCFVKNVALIFNYCENNFESLLLFFIFICSDSI